MRDYETLLRHGEEVLAEYRQSVAAGDDLALLPRPGGVDALERIGRIVQVSLADPELGPHLVARLQGWEGSPPSPTDVPDAEIVCHASPNRVVEDYSAGEFIRVVAVQGAMLAMKLT